MTEIFQSLTAQDREDLQWMLECGLTKEAAAELMNLGLAEEAKAGTRTIPRLPNLYTQSAIQDLACFSTGERRKQIENLLSRLRSGITEARCEPLNGATGWLLRDGPFCIVFRSGKTEADDLVFAIAAAGINPITKVWRYFDQGKAEDFLRTGSLYFCRLDQLTGDPCEARLPLFGKQLRTSVFREHFGESAREVIAEKEEILRGTSYICCWTRREQESYLAWKHYCSMEGGRPGGGFAIQTTWRRLVHFHSAMRAEGIQLYCRSVGYLDPLSDDIPNHSEGEQLFWKSDWFSDEAEIRLAMMRPQSGAFPEIRKRIAEEMPKGEKIRCDMNSLVEKIVLNPFASAEQGKELKDLLAGCCPELISKVQQSAINSWPRSAAD